MINWIVVYIRAQSVLSVNFIFECFFLLNSIHASEIIIRKRMNRVSYAPIEAHPKWRRSSHALSELCAATVYIDKSQGKIHTYIYQRCTRQPMQIGKFCEITNVIYSMRDPCSRTPLAVILNFVSFFAGWQRSWNEYKSAWIEDKFIINYLLWYFESARAHTHTLWTCARAAST